MISFSDAVIADRLKAFTRALDGGASNSQLQIYTGARPEVKGGGITTQELIVTFLFPRPSLVSVAASTLLFTQPPTAMCVLTGDPHWGRIVDGSGVFIADCDVGLTGSGLDVEIDHSTLYQGGEVNCVVGNLIEV